MSVGTDPVRERVAIVGGGCGGVAAAFWLSSTPALRARFKVTLYTHGWRLGGKGASGRNGDEAQRIEEHGLHLWMGCYRRAFQIMRAALAADPRAKKTLEDVFAPILDLTLLERDGDSWSPWKFKFAPRKGFPDEMLGDAFSGQVVSYADWLQGFMDDSLSDHVDRDAYAPALKALRTAASDGIHGDALEAAKLLEAVNGAITSQLPADSIEPTGKVMPAKLSLPRLLTLANLGFALAAGAAKDVLAAPNSQTAFEALDDLEFGAWLRSHGAHPKSVASAPVRGLYDLAFAYPGGDPEKPGALAAGAILGLVLRMADYKGAPFWRMNGGMGDAIFAPFYRVLRAHDVDVAFFHRLVDASSSDGGHIDELRFHRQAATDPADYNPFVVVKDEQCWPNQPKWKMLVDGDDLARRGVDFESSAETAHVDVHTIRRGADVDGFEHVVLAVPPDVLKVTTATLDDDSWTGMLAKSTSTFTQAFQLWISEETQTIGWPPGALASTYEQPFATWADMSHLLPMEDWQAPTAPRSVHYFCGPMLQDADPQDVHVNAHRWIKEALSVLWQGSPPKEIVISDFMRANTDLSERYVQVPPGNPRHRLRPGEAPYRNLALAGDWTRLPHSGGSVENAIESGLLAARKISGDPNLGGS